MVDQFFTPIKIAESTLSKHKKKKFNIVADFTIGDGSFIQSISEKATNVIGLDLDPDIISDLRHRNPTWNLHNGDFIDSNEKTIAWLENYKSKVDLIVLNPPFSCRGGSRMNVHHSGKIINCRTALAFLLKSLDYLNQNGILIAILPLSTLKSEVDRSVFSYVESKYDIEYGEKLGSDSFPGCNPKSVIITIQKRKKNSHKLKDEKIAAPNKSAEILRGNTSMHRTNATGKYKVLHSTNLKNRCLMQTDFKFTEMKKRAVKGQYLCIPRVGKPIIEKIVLVTNRTTFILSDCVIAIRGKTPCDTLFLQNLIQTEWEYFAKLYESTCAPYITINQIVAFLLKHQISSSIKESFC